MKQEQKTLAQRYAQALFDLCVENKQLETVGSQLQKMVDLLADSHELHHLFTHPVFPLEQRKSIVRTIADKSQFLPVVQNFLLLLLEQQRGALLLSIQQTFQELQDKHQNRVHIDAITSREVSSEFLKQLEQQLKQTTQKDVVLHVSTDTSLVGGVCIKMGDRMLDGSLRTRLQQMKEQLLAQI